MKNSSEKHPHEFFECVESRSSIASVRREIEKEMWHRVDEGSHEEYISEQGLLEDFYWRSNASYEKMVDGSPYCEEFVGRDGLPAAIIYNNGRVCVSGCKSFSGSRFKRREMMFIAEIQVAVNEELIRRAAKE